jgi:hypothetical protein
VVTCECGAEVWIKKRGMCKACYFQWYQRERVGRDKQLEYAARSARKRWLAREVGHACLLDVNYMGAHMRLRAMRGMARDYDCVQCGMQAKDWALIRGGVREVVSTRVVQNKQGEDCTRVCVFSTNPLDYQPMCRRCHVHMDRPKSLSRLVPGW